MPSLIDPAFLSDPAGRDLVTMRAGLRIAEELAATRHLSRLAGPTSDDMASNRRDAELRARASCYWHLVGTCAMGADSDLRSVVAGDARVHGIHNLRIVDASILPDPPAANTQLSVLAVAEMLVVAMRT